METAFYFNFDFYQALKQHGYHDLHEKNTEIVNLQIVIRNQNLNRKVVLIVLI